MNSNEWPHLEDGRELDESDVVSWHCNFMFHE